MDLNDVRADDLRFLAAIADTGRLTLAATALGVNHATASRRLRALEKALNARLVEQGAHGWELTETGRAVVVHARTIRSAVESAARAAEGAEADYLTGTVRVTASDGFGTLFVVPALARVRAEHPGLNVELITGARHLTLRDSSFDLAVTLGRPPVTHLHTERLAGYDSAFYASETYLAANGDPASAEELGRHSLIFFVDTLQQVRELDLAEYIPEPRIRFSSNNVFAQLEATRRGIGISLLSKFVASTAPGIRRIAAPITPARVPITLAVRKDAMSRRDVLVVREALRAEVRSRKADLVW